MILGKDTGGFHKQVQSYTIFVLIISLGCINLFFFLGVESTSKCKI
ncbi:hypothetical protein HMPREF1870_01081, partial [Bacteroidales bacterium KA00344]